MKEIPQKKGVRVEKDVHVEKDTRKKGEIDLSRGNIGKISEHRSSYETGVFSIDGEGVKYEGKGLRAKLEKEGIKLIQSQTSNSATLTMGSNSYSMVNEEESTELHGPNMHFSMEEIGSNRRRITIDGYPGGPRTVEVGEDNPKGTIGNLELKHRTDDGGLEIETEVEGEKEKITINGYGKDRNMIYEYGDKLGPTYFKADVSSVNNSIKEAYEQSTKNLKATFGKKYPLVKRYGGDGVIDMVQIVNAEVTVVV